LRNVALALAPGVEEWLATRGHDPKYGARPLLRVLQRELIAPLAEALNAAAHRPALTARAGVGRRGDSLEIELRQDRESAASDAGSRIAETVQRLRRKVTQFARGPAMRALENEAPVLAAIERRRRRTGIFRPEDHAVLERLKQIEQLRAGLSALARRADALETETLAEFHLGGISEDSAAREETSRIEPEMRQLRRSLYRLSFSDPDNLVMAIYGEPREWAEALLRIYLGHAAALGGEVVKFDFVAPRPDASEDRSTPLRIRVEKPAECLKKPPEIWVGAILHLRGDFFRPRFAAEAGIHKYTHKGGDRLCLVEIADDFEEYKPPQAIHRAGTINEKKYKLRRAFTEETQRCQDAELGSCGWTDFGKTTTGLLEERLERAVEEFI